MLQDNDISEISASGEDFCWRLDLFVNNRIEVNRASEKSGYFTNGGGGICLRRFSSHCQQ